MPVTGYTNIPDIPITFPLAHNPRAGSWEAYPRGRYWLQSAPSGFRHGRPADGRSHAAVDLYAPVGTIVMAVADGRVVDTKRVFQPDLRDETPTNSSGKVSTVAIAVEHPGLGIIRYCELDQNLALGVFWHAPVRRGQILGMVGFQGARFQGAGQNRRLVPEPAMLHLEWYSDWRDNRIDPNFDHAQRPHVLSQAVVRVGGRVVIEANTQYDNFPQGLPFERRHDLVDPTPMIRAATPATQPHILRHFGFERDTQIDFGPSFAFRLRRAQLQQPKSSGPVWTR